MAVLYLIVALIIQGTLTYGDITNSEELIESLDATNNKVELDDEVVKDYHNAKKDWIDMFLQPDMQLYPSSSVAIITQALSEKPVEEQLADLKGATETITQSLQSEMVKLLSYALSSVDEKAQTESNDTLRKKRSTENPMASTKLINRLLRHIKSNNEYQNIAIEKMMTAQEIADKYGVEYSPETEIISDLAFAANEQAKEMTSLLQDALKMKNSSRVEDNQNYNQDVYHVYSEPKYEPAVNHHHHSEPYPMYYPYESQIPAPSQNYNNAPVTQRPNFYDTVNYSPDYYSSYCSMDPFTSANVGYGDLYEPEPELVGEELEETVSSKLYVERGDEPGSATLNHVMTYTVGEKSHFRRPNIDHLPQHMQYCFFLM